MIILDSTNKSIQLVMGGGIVSQAPTFVASYVDLSSTAFLPIENDGVLNGITAVTAVSSPTSGFQRQIKYLSICNNDTVQQTVYVYLLNGSNMQFLVSIAVPTGNTLVYNCEGGWELFPYTTINYPITVPQGGTGSSSFSAFCLIAAGTANQSPLTSLASTGNSFQILTSNGAGYYPTWQNAPSGGSGSLTSFSAGNLSPLFTTSVLNPTSTPNLSFSLSTSTSHTWFGNNTGSTTTPSYNSAGNLTSSNDTNVTITLGGTPTNSLLNSASITMGWTGQLGLTRGGTNASLTASNGGIVYSTASALAILSGTSTANQILMSGSSSAPSWSTATYPPTTTISQILYSSANNTVTGLATANSSVLVTNGSGVPSLNTALPNGITATTQSALDNSTKVATTAYVDSAVSTINPSFITMSACLFFTNN